MNKCDTSEAARLAADVLGIDYRAAVQDDATASQRREQLEAERTQLEQERLQRAVVDAQQRRATFSRLYDERRQSATQGESEYLTDKGAERLHLPHSFRWFNFADPGR